MFMTPPAPSFVQMRDGLLDYLAAGKGPADSAARTCDVWRGFAAYGLGEGATGTEVFVGTDENGYAIYAVTVGESFQIPAKCGGGAAPKPSAAAVAAGANANGRARRAAAAAVYD
jgi:hypothetical protein